MLFLFLCFNVPKNEWQEKVFIGGLKAVEIICWKESKDQNWKAFTAKGIINLLFYPMFPFKLCIWVVLSLEVHKHKLIGKKRHDKSK